MFFFFMILIFGFLFSESKDKYLYILKTKKIISLLSPCVFLRQKKQGKETIMTATAIKIRAVDARNYRSGYVFPVGYI